MCANLARRPKHMYLLYPSPGPIKLRKLRKSNNLGNSRHGLYTRTLRFSRIFPFPEIPCVHGYSSTMCPPGLPLAEVGCCTRMSLQSAHARAVTRGVGTQHAKSGSPLRETHGFRLGKLSFVFSERLACPYPPAEGPQRSDTRLALKLKNRKTTGRLVVSGLLTPSVVQTFVDIERR